VTAEQSDRVTSGSRLTAEDVAAAAQLACLLEASAPKPGNVSPGRHFADATFEDFLASAVAIRGPLAGAGTRSLGATIRLCVESTSRWTTSNTNLGIVLLLAPLARGAIVGSARGAPGRIARVRGSRTLLPAEHLRQAVRCVLDATTVDDARDVYKAIRLAAPGGLGRADGQDVAEDPTMSLVDVMRLAASRDDIAREYAMGFEITFERGVPALDRARRDGLSWADAVVETFLELLAARSDTHVCRRAGPDVAADASRRAAEALAAGGVRTAAGRRTIEDMDRTLRDPRHRANPGTTADLTAAAILVVLLDNGWRAPQPEEINAAPR
jgi:triphosphoribosyl-dephospho-CoA synthase